MNLILADSNDLMRLGLRTVLTAELNVTIVGEARNEKELVSQLASFGATVVLIDFTSEGFTKVKLEHKQPNQIGNGLNLKLKKPWEMHIRMVDLKKGLIGIHAEVEVSRDYLQHLVSQRTPVIYEVEEIMKKYQVDYKIWHDKIKKNVHTVFDNYKVKLATPSIPVFAWKPMLFVIGTVSIFYLWKFISTI